MNSLIYHHFLILILLIIVIALLIFVVIIITRYYKKQKFSVWETDQMNTNNFGSTVFEDRLETIKKLIEICLIHNSVNKKVIQQYSQVVGKDILEYYLNLENIVQTIDFLHNNFTRKIKTEFPYLTKKDILLCALVKGKFQTNEIAALMSHQEDSIRTMKVRLRTKMKFSSQSDFLSYMNNL